MLDGGLYDSGGMQLSDPDAESQIIGYLLNKPDACADVFEVLGANDFSDPINRRMFEVVGQNFERGDKVTFEAMVAAMGGDPKAILFDDVTVSRYIATLISEADLSEDPSALAEHLAACSERRAIGAADDVYVPFESKFGGLRWEEIGTSSGGMGYTWVVEDILPMAEIALAYGDSGTGKSFDIFDMSLAVARGLPFNGHNVEPGLVVYVAAEGGKGFDKRKVAYSLHHGLQPDIALPFFLCTKRPDFFNADIDLEALIVEIEKVRRLFGQKLILIVLDTLSAVAPGMNENASQDVSRVRARLVRLLEHFRVSIILVHHKPKNGAGPRGHGSLTADFETTIEFETLEDRKTRTGANVHRAIVRKQREGKSGIAWEFTLPVVTVGKNKWGNDETSCVVAPFDSNPRNSPGGFHATPSERLFLQSLFDAVIEHGVAPPPGLPAAVTKAVDIAHVRAKMKSKVITGEEDSTKADNRFRTAFKRAGDALRAGGVIGFQNPLTWYTSKPVKGFSAPEVSL